jgi:hypothetical protein
LSDSLRQHRSGYYIDQDIGGSNAEEARDLDPPYWSVARRRFDGLHHRVIQARVRQRLYCSSFEGFALSLTAASHLPTFKLSGIAMDVGAGFIRMVPTAIMPWTMVRLSASEPRSAARMSAPNINFKTTALRQNHVGDDLDGDAPRQTATQINLNWWCASLGDGSIGAERRAALWDQIYG